MFSAVELVLEIERKPLVESLRPRAVRSRVAKQETGNRSAGPAIADALKRIHGVAMTSSRQALTMRIFERRGDGARVVLEESSGTRRVLASYATPLAPGVTLRQTVRDERVEPGTPFATSEALPAEFEPGSGESEEWAPATPLAAYQTGFQWHAPDGGSVDIVLLDAFDIATGQDSPAAQGTPDPSKSFPLFCELRLSVQVECDDCSRGQDGDVNPDGHEDGPAKAATSALFAAAQLLVDRLPAFPVLIDAYARAAGDALGAEPVRAAHVDLAGVRTPHEALIAIAGNVARQWFGNERGVRESADVEFVHQMRVALRRAKTLIKTFPRWADDAWKARVAPGFQWIGEVLGEARDLDVLVDSTLPALAAADADPSAWSGLIASADARRLEARERLQQALRSRRYAQLSLAWLEWLAGQRFSPGSPSHAQHALEEYVLKRARRHFERLTAEPALTSLDAAGRHRRRIEAKRLRYTLEFFEPLVAPGRRRKIAGQLSRIQTVLGEGSDLAAALRFFDLGHFDVTPYQRGFVRGWCEAVNRSAAQEAERLVRKLRKPKIIRRA